MSDAHFREESSVSLPIKPSAGETTVQNLTKGGSEPVSKSSSDYKDAVPEPLVTEIDIEFSEDHLSGQKETIQSEFDLKEYEADILYDAILRLVREQADELNKGWSEEVVESVANLVAAMMIQEKDQRPENI